MNLFDAEPLLQTGVYLIINALDGKRYIGSTAKSFKARMSAARLAWLEKNKAND